MECIRIVAKAVRSLIRMSAQFGWDPIETNAAGERI